MNQDNIDTRLTAYAFGELSPEQSEALESELSRSSELRSELASVREAIAALEFEFQSQSSDVAAEQRRQIQRAIGQRMAPPIVASATANDGASTADIRPISEDSFRRRAIFVAALACSVLIVASLTLPQFRDRGEDRLTLRDGMSLDDASDVMVSLQQEREQLAKFNELIQQNRLEEAAAVADQFGDLQPDNPISQTMRESSRLAKALSGSDESQPAADPVMNPSAAVGSATNAAQPNETNLPAVRVTKGRAVTEQMMPSQAVPMQMDMMMGMEDSGSHAGDKMFESMDDEVAEVEVMDESIDMNMDGGDMEADYGYAMDGMDEMGGMMGGGMPAPGKRTSRMDRNQNGSNVGDEMSSDGGMMMMGGMGGMGGERMGEMSFGVSPMGLGAVDAGSVVDSFAVTSGVTPNVDSLDVMSGMMEMSGGDQLDRIVDNPFMDVTQAPLSTFSIDVDTASYSKIRSLLSRNALPSPDAVRIEEMLNYFDYDYPPPQDEHPFAASMEVAQCPWNPDHRLARVGIRGKVLEADRPSSNLVFLLDVSGSMDERNKLPLVVEGMKMLTDQLTENDKVAIVVYAGAAGMVLDSTRGDHKQQIDAALDRLKAGGSTNGGQGILLAYQIARDNFIVGGTNRVILCSDGDFNVGVTGTDQLVSIAQENAKSNIFLSVLGFGIGNHNDSMMEQISNKGNGNYAFIDSKAEARKVLVEELGGTLVTIAKDVKVQIEFNPKEVASYRLIGYENRVMAAADFSNDQKDAGEIGAGHTVTALYEIVPATDESSVAEDESTPTPREKLRYQSPQRLSEQAESGELLILKLRYKQPEGDTSTLVEFPVNDTGKDFVGADRDFQFAASVAAFGMLLRDSPHKGSISFATLEPMAREAAKGDDFGYRDEFVSLVSKARELRGE